MSKDKPPNESERTLEQAFAQIAVSFFPAEDHAIRGHPEGPARLTGIPGLLDSLKPQLVDPRPVDKEFLSLVHTTGYLDRLEYISGDAPRMLDPDTYITPFSWQAATTSAGCTLAVLEAVLQGEAKRGFAIARPPGHHATADRAMGFCLLNNVAIGARRAQQLGLERIFIVDFDVHHGNGTQAIFYNDPQIYYFSTHQWGIYPGTGRMEERGAGEGLGTTANLPLPAGCGDGALERAFTEILTPLVNQFQPQLILVSAGFDAHWRDPLAGLQLSARGYYRLVRILAELAEASCQGRLVLSLEGGYDRLALTDSINQCLHALVGLPAPQPRTGPAPFPEPQVESLLKKATAILLE
jgi:acetoin utilization deacetylase AcuC-like enzyme